LAALRPLQRGFEKGAGGFDGAEARRLALRLLALLAALARHLEAGLARQILDRFGKRQIGSLHGKADGVAMRAAAEAMIEALILDDVEGRGLFLVERAEA